MDKIIFEVLFPEDYDRFVEFMVNKYGLGIKSDFKNQTVCIKTKKAKKIFDNIVKYTSKSYLQNGDKNSINTQIWGCDVNVIFVEYSPEKSSIFESDLKVIYNNHNGEVTIK
jgi:hypothetical protein